MSDRPKTPERDEWQPPSDVEKNWAMIAHMGAFVGVWLGLGALAPFLVFLTQGKQSEFVRRHAVESLNFQINALFWFVVSFALLVIVIGVFMLPIFGLYYLVVVVLGSVAAFRGHRFRYPMILRLVK